MDASRQNHFGRKAFRYMSEHTHEKMLYLLSNLSFLNVRYTVFAFKVAVFDTLSRIQFYIETKL